MGIGAPHHAFKTWIEARPQDAGLSPNLGHALERAFNAGSYPGLHGLLIVRNGELGFEHHFPGADETWGEGLGNVSHHADLPHDLRSITKSIVSLLYGIALGDGLVPPAATKLIDALPEHADLLDASPEAPDHHRACPLHAHGARMGGRPRLLRSR